jgi:hypothetical protein
VLQQWRAQLPVLPLPQPAALLLLYHVTAAQLAPTVLAQLAHVQQPLLLLLELVLQSRCGQPPAALT